MITRDQLEDLSDTVDTCLREDPKSRNSDKRLIYYITRRKQRLNLNNYERGFKHIVKPASVIRIRQSLQSGDNVDEQLLPTSEEVARKRRINEKVMEQVYGSS